jgi:hypothetical protein
MGIPKFLLAENPMASESEYIVFTGAPSVIFEVAFLLPGEVDNEIKSENIFYYLNPDGILERYYLKLSAIFGNQSNKIDRIVKSAMKWYGAYLTYEDEQAGKHGRVLNLTDYHPSVKDLKVVHVVDENTFVLIHYGKILKFMNPETTISYIKTNYKITDTENVIINNLRKFTPNLN